MWASSTSIPSENPSSGNTCCDGKDNDCDGYVDGADSACVENNNVAGTCTNTKDDDCDGKIDREDLPDCCIAHYGDCTVGKSNQCCDYTGYAGGWYCSTAAKCISSASCTTWQFCSSSYWSIECLTGMQFGYACCTSAYMGYPELNNGIQDIITTY